MRNGTAEPVAAQGSTKRRTLLIFCAAWATALTRVLSPRQLPTDHDHAVPTREYQSDQSSRYAAGLPSALLSKEPRGTKPTVSFPLGIPILPSTRLRAHQRERVPAKPPVEVAVDARTVLVVKGSLRRAKLRRALDDCAPFRPKRNRDGRLRREHSTVRAKDRGGSAPIEGANPPEIKTRQPCGGLTRSLHIRS